MAIFAPNANSYRRFRANSYAPVAPTWGVNNRTVSLRIPAGVTHSIAVVDKITALQVYAPGGPEQRFKGGPDPDAKPSRSKKK